MSIPTTPLKDTKLFKEIQVGHATLQNRVVFAPSTRFRALKGNVPSDLQVDYYDERTKSPGSLVITEGTIPTEKTGVYSTVPGIYSDEQVKAWKHITDRVHANNSFMGVQLWGLGRVADPTLGPIVAPSAVYSGADEAKAAAAAKNEIHVLSEKDIEDIIEDYGKAAQNALDAGFDFIEVHCAHGYLLHTFLETSSNKRTDKYGGSIENRARFPLQVIDKVIEVAGADKIAVRVSPWTTFQGMKAAKDEIHPYTTYSYFVHELQKRADSGNKLAYLSVVEPRSQVTHDVLDVEPKFDNEFIKQMWDGVLLRAGGYSYDVPEFKDLKSHIEDDRTLIGFSRYYISNPDLVYRLQHGHPLNQYERATFYDNCNWGYNTYCKHGEEVDFDEETERKRLAQPIAVSS